MAIIARMPSRLSTEVLETLAELFVTYGLPAHIRSDNGPEFTATLIREWPAALNVDNLLALCTAPGSLDTHLCYTAWRSSYSSRASIGV